MFLLSKWYHDCVTDAGEAFIGYWAQLRLGVFTLPYSACIFHPAAKPSWQRLTFRRSSEPEIVGGELRWTCRPLGVRGTWATCAAPYHRTLFASPQGSIAWNCHVPRARARVYLSDGAKLTGLGYVEHLLLSLKPSRLPMDELRWGRFLSPEDTVVWIEWLGQAPRHWLFHNGIEMHEATITGQRIELSPGSGVVELRDAVVLRDGRLGTTALPSILGAGLLPRSLRNMRETKWLARGTLKTAGRASSGWAIHEVVRWR